MSMKDIAYYVSAYWLKAFVLFGIIACPSGVFTALGIIFYVAHFIAEQLDFENGWKQNYFADKISISLAAIFTAIGFI